MDFFSASLKLASASLTRSPPREAISLQPPQLGPQHEDKVSKKAYSLINHVITMVYSGLSRGLCSPLVHPHCSEHRLRPRLPHCCPPHHHVSEVDHHFLNASLIILERICMQPKTAMDWGEPGYLLVSCLQPPRPPPPHLTCPP